MHIDVPHAKDVPFLLQRRQRRLPGALGVSLLTHVAMFLATVVVIRSVPESTVRELLTPPNADIVWLETPGPGGGGGGGGNEMPEPPRKAELPGKDKISVPVTEPLKPVPEPKDEPPSPELNIPAKTLAAAEQTLPGALEGIPGVALSQGPGTGGGFGTGTGTGIGSGTGSGLGPGVGGGTGGGVYRPGSGVSTPQIIRQVKPNYTSDAMRAKIQGDVWLEAVVLPDGSVGEVTVIRSLDSAFGLDGEAIKAARQWKFTPGLRQGQPVAVLITIQMTFTLR
jgi:TonB family protein